LKRLDSIHKPWHPLFFHTKNLSNKFTENIAFTAILYLNLMPAGRRIKLTRGVPIPISLTWPDSSYASVKRELPNIGITEAIYERAMRRYEHLDQKCRCQRTAQNLGKLLRIPEELRQALELKYIGSPSESREERQKEAKMKYEKKRLLRLKKERGFVSLNKLKPWESLGISRMTFYTRYPTREDRLRAAGITQALGALKSPALTSTGPKSPGLKSQSHAASREERQKEAKRRHNSKRKASRGFVSLSKLKPWESLGISRMTFYRKYPTRADRLRAAGVTASLSVH
jgi:hypothetical protein